MSLGYALMDLKTDAYEVAQLGSGVLVGAAAAKFITSPKSPIDGLLSKLPANKWTRPLVPIAAGIAIHKLLKYRYPVAAPAVAAGMVGHGIAALVKSAVTMQGQPAAGSIGEKIADAIPFAGVDSYDSGLMGLGYGYGADVSRYTMAGAPVQVQRINGAPVQVQSLAGLGSFVPGSAPLSASLS